MAVRIDHVTGERFQHRNKALAAGKGAAPMHIRTNRRDREQSALTQEAVIGSAIIPESHLEREQSRIPIFCALRRRDDSQKR
ncbi:MAG: hypothetical protein E5X49_14325 [Mesorhizobium sp.]|uniref:hypothetical protein n=1 Tax=Mesorhizobium sp. TaxID=1871066 RepID=UPI000FE407C2|nr:hypothetical protein [Mesorhizobium sp.]RWG78373.1 MAG: hypothetical protein EOQ69_26500 [Mesorhizobium sp.]RWJ96529.1 MAG: hypothetical protein EOR42_30040 [Mesorhizobium sp.]RWK23512.1 MAG: hypothetical protein EOR43_13800 [Mesorhizobium sp.]RWK30900.1 MAG: hypothetical protein EOR44_15245 [Mesorhizobium sp.]TIQ42666.1 MAG: hypothetical protein E5X49_14325 [Mesorhizobium sp.]